MRGNLIKKKEKSKKKKDAGERGSSHDHVGCDRDADLLPLPLSYCTQAPTNDERDPPDIPQTHKLLEV